MKILFPEVVGLFSKINVKIIHKLRIIIQNLCLPIKFLKLLFKILSMFHLKHSPFLTFIFTLFTSNYPINILSPHPGPSHALTHSCHSHASILIYARPWNLIQGMILSSEPNRIIKTEPIFLRRVSTRTPTFPSCQSTFPSCHSMFPHWRIK